MYNYNRDSICYYSVIFNEAKFLVYFIKLTSFFAVAPMLPNDVLFTIQTHYIQVL